MEFRSTQAPELGPDGQDCTLWHNDYRLRASHGRHQIYQSDATYAPC